MAFFDSAFFDPTFFDTVVTPSITAVTASNITQTSATITVTRSNPAEGTLYFFIVPQGAELITENIVASDTNTDPGVGNTYQFVPDADGLSAGTAYDLWAAWDDGETTVGPVQGTGFSTASAASNIPVLSAPSFLNRVPQVTLTFE